MEMQDPEIVMNYRQARDKHQQIYILADLNNCGVDMIKTIVGGEIKRSFEMIEKYYNQGLKDREIAALIGTEKSFVCQWRKKNNLPSKNKIRLNYDDAEMIRLYDLGLNDVEIGLKVNMPHQKVMKWRHNKRLKSKFKKGNPL